MDEYDKTIVIEGSIALRKSAWKPDWYTIERAEHDDSGALIPAGPRALRFVYSGRVSDADVEGDAECMREVAKAIRARGYYSEKRCGVSVTGERVRLWSPRNSQRPASVSLEAADALAAQIEAVLGAGDAA